MDNLRALYAQLSYQVALYREQLRIIKEETDRINLSSLELANAIKAVEGMKEDKVLIPIGGGAFVKGKVEDIHILVPVGAQYLIEMNREEAEEELKSRMEATNKAVVRLSDEFNKILAKLEEVSKQLKEVEAKLAIDEKVEENLKEDYI